MGNFFGAIFKLAGGLVMVLSVIAGLMVLMALASKGGLGGKAWIIALITGIPFLFGRLFYGIGKRLQQEERENFTPAPPDSRERETAVTRRPAQSEFKRWKEAVDVDIAPEAGPWAAAAKRPAPRKEAAPAPQRETAPRRENKPDPFAMGVDTLYDPDKDGKGGAT
jgi:hypothetical protein